jgi:hypothetical protein
MYHGTPLVFNFQQLNIELTAGLKAVQAGDKL